MRSVGLAGLLLAAACTASPAELPWKITTADDGIVRDARSFEAEIRRAGCDGAILHREVFTDVAATPPVLAPGDYAFVVRARGADCRVIGEGCSQITLPTTDECVEVELRGSAGAACPPASTCVDGACQLADASIPDATPADTSRPDTAMPDGDVPDTGTPECSTDADCDDAEPCTDDRCDAGTCVYVANSNPCDDAEFCNGDDVCAGGTCTHAGNPCAGTCDSALAACGSDCGTFFGERGCAEGTMISSESRPTLLSCEEYCETLSFTAPVDCCQYDGLGACTAFRDSSGLGVAAMAFAATCVR